MSGNDIIPINPPMTNPSQFTPASLLPRQLNEVMATILPQHHRLVYKKHRSKRVMMEVDDDDVSLKDGRVKLLKRRKGDVQAGEEEWAWLSVDDSVEIQTDQGRSTVGLIRSIIATRSGTSHKRVNLHIQWVTPFDADKEWRGGVQELFLTDAHCDDVSISKVVRKVDVTYVRPGGRVPTDVLRQFCRFVITADHRVRDPVDGAPCDSCHRKAVLSSSPLVTARSLRLPGISAMTLHQYDFVLIDPKSTGQTYIIGQIKSFFPKDQTIELRLFQRRANLNKADFMDERRICITDDYQVVPAGLVRARCHVVTTKDELSRWENHAIFWCDSRWSSTQQKVVNLQGGLPKCETCDNERMSVLPVNRHFSRLAADFRVADYYSGGGGGILSACRYFSVVSAVDMDPNACSTIAQNFPGITISCAAVSDLLHREKQYEAGGQVHELYADKHLNRPASRRLTVPRLPQRGSILLMMGGVPCQGHSRANQYQQVDDERNEELFVFLSEVERVQPSYVIIENVPGFKDDRADGSFAEEGGIKSYAAAAQTLLIQLDYQCQLAILDARSFGSAQNRVRLWIVAAKRGLPLPEIPQPSHANPKVRATVFARAGVKTSTYTESGTPGCGAYPAVTVQDAISDLPPFDFELPGTPARRGIPSYAAGSAGVGTDTRVGFDRPMPYRTPPTTLFQKRMRGDQLNIVDHFTPSRSLAEVEKCHIAFVARREGDLRGCEKRLDPNGGFKALLTSNAPGRRASRPIHYEQRRTKTVAEDKRAMGFPDTYRLSGSAKEQIAQLGNAWCVHMGKAVVKSVHDAIRHEWLKDGQSEDLQRWWKSKNDRLDRGTDRQT